MHDASCECYDCFRASNLHDADAAAYRKPHRTKDIRFQVMSKRHLEYAPRDYLNRLGNYLKIEGAEDMSHGRLARLIWDYVGPIGQ